MVADLDPLGITTSAPKEIGGTERRANENVTRKYFNFGKETIYHLHRTKHCFLHSFAWKCFKNILIIKIIIEIRRLAFFDHFSIQQTNKIFENEKSLAYIS